MLIKETACVACSYHWDDLEDEELRLYPFPEDKNIKKIWIKNLKISNVVGNNPNARVCSRHFFNEYFNEDEELIFHATPQFDIENVRRLNNAPKIETPTKRKLNISEDVPTYDSINTSTDSYSSNNSSQRSFNKSEKPEKERNSFYWKVAIVLAIVVVIITFFVKSGNEESSGHKTCPGFLQLEEDFKDQDQDIWKLLKIGTERVLNKKPSSLGCYIFAADDNQFLEEVVSAIVNTTANCLKSGSKPLILESNDFASARYLDDKSKIVHDFKPKLSASGILAIKDFNRIPIEVIPAFHSFCDTYNPLVDKAIIILAMQVSRIPTNHGNPTQFMNKYLQEKWDSLSDDIREPLITRVTENSFILVKE